MGGSLIYQTKKPTSGSISSRNGQTSIVYSLEGGGGGEIVRESLTQSIVMLRNVQ